MKKNINDCEICFENIYFKKELINCAQCKKNICFKCYISILEKMKNIRDYICPYCRFEPSIIQIAFMLSKLKKTIYIYPHLNFKWIFQNNTEIQNIINIENIDNNNLNLKIIIQNLHNHNIDDIDLLIKNYLIEKGLFPPYSS